MPATDVEPSRFKWSLATVDLIKDSPVLLHLARLEHPGHVEFAISGMDALGGRLRDRLEVRRI